MAKEKDQQILSWLSLQQMWTFDMFTEFWYQFLVRLSTPSPYGIIQQ